MILPPLRYMSVCSGIEAATVAWHPLGWQAAAYADIEPFPSHVLHHHYSSGRPRFMPSPDAAGLDDDDIKRRRAAIKAVAALPVDTNGAPNLGDMTQFEEWPDVAIDLLVGGTPCQDYSVAGLRAGMDGVRGSLTLTYAAIARRYRPRWLAWENVPGVLSSNDGRDFASFLGLCAGRRVEVPPGGWQSAGIVPGYSRAYGLAWRVLDAQYVRVDGFLRAVPQRRRRVFVVGYLGDWRRAAAVLFEREGMCGHPAPRRESGQIAAPTISARSKGGGGLGTDFELDGGLIAFGGNNTSGAIDVSAALNAKSTQRQDFETETLIVAPPVAASLTRGAESSGKGGYAGRRQEDDHNIIAFDARQSDVVQYGNIAGPLDTDPHSQAVLEKWAVRRLMPVECERLQGFPDGYTGIDYRGGAAADGPRYKALGNSMAVNVMRWLGQRIEIVRGIA